MLSFFALEDLGCDRVAALLWKKQIRG